jgi:hypothetical protein
VRSDVEIPAVSLGFSRHFVTHKYRQQSNLIATLLRVRKGVDPWLFLRQHKLDFRPNKSIRAGENLFALDSDFLRISPVPLVR